MSDTPFTTVARVKAFMTLGKNVTTDLPLIQVLIDGASQSFRTRLNRDILSAQYDEVRDGSGSNTLVLYNYPITVIDSVEVGALPGTRSPLVADRDFVVTKTAIKLLGGGRFPLGVATVRVVYSAGFSDVPLDLAEACAKTVAFKYRQLERIGQNSKTLQGETVTFDDSDFTKDVASLLENYKRRILTPSS